MVVTLADMYKVRSNRESGYGRILVSGVLSLALVKGMAGNMWFMWYHFTVMPATAAICLLLTACISAMTDRIWNKDSIVEQLRELM